MCSVLTLSIGNNQGMGDVEYGKIYDIYFPPAYLRLFDGPNCNVVDMWRILNRGMSNGGLIVGTIIKPKLGLQPKPFGEACYAFWQGGDFIKNDEPQGNQVFCQMNECIPEVVKAMRAAIKETGSSKLFSANITADDPNEMIARGKYVLSQFGPLGENCAFLVDGYVAGGTAITVARRNFPSQFLHYHRAGHGAITSPQTQRGYTAFVHTKISRVIGASGIHTGTMSFGKMEGDASDKNIAFMLQDDEADGPYYHQEWEGMKQTTPIISGGMNALRLPAFFENLGHSNVILTAGGGSFGHKDGPKPGAISCRQGEESWKEWKAGKFGDVSLSDGIIEFAKTHEELKGAFLTFQKDADQIYPGWKEKLGYTGESSVQAATFDWAKKAAAASFVGSSVAPAQKESSVARRALDQSSRYADLSLDEEELIKNGKHLLVAYIMKPKAGYDYLATAAHFAAESSTGTNVNVCTTDDFTKSVDALVYYIDPDNEEMKIAYPTLLFDRNITDGRAMMCSVLTLSIGNNQGMGDVEYGKIYDIYFPPAYLRLFDGPNCNVVDMWRILNRGMSNGGLIVGTIIKPKLGLQPKPFGEACYAFWQGGDFIKNDEPQGNQVFCQMNECIPEVVKAMRAAIKETGSSKLFSANITADDPNEMIARGKYAGKFGDVSLSDGIIEFAKTHEELKGAFLTFQKDADQIYPGWKEKLGYTGESSVQAATFDWAKKAAAAPYIGGWVYAKTENLEGTYWNEVGYCPDGTAMNLAGNNMNHPERIGKDSHTPGSTLPKSFYMNAVGYLPDGTPLNMAGNNVNHPERNGSPLPPPLKGYVNDIGYTPDGTPMNKAGNLSVKKHCLFQANCEEARLGIRSAARASLARSLAYALAWHPVGVNDISQLLTVQEEQAAGAEAGVEAPSDENDAAPEGIAARGPSTVISSPFSHRYFKEDEALTTDAIAEAAADIDPSDGRPAVDDITMTNLLPPADEDVPSWAEFHHELLQELACPAARNSKGEIGQPELVTLYNFESKAPLLAEHAVVRTAPKDGNPGGRLVDCFAVPAAWNRGLIAPHGSEGVAADQEVALSDEWQATSTCLPLFHEAESSPVGSEDYIQDGRKRNRAVLMSRKSIRPELGAGGRRSREGLSAFRRALELGADGVELDVHLSADGHAVVIHDSWLDRTTGSSGPVGALPLDELRRVSLLPGASLPTTTTVTTTTTTMPIGQQQQQQTSATDAADVTGLPTLAEVLRLVVGRHRRRCLIELKGPFSGLPRILSSLAGKAGA
ncbi:unnamed protein product [Polarella glacialis]|uniref:ribulose-bisphosphate carboxylase n=1 Tax=Polarella glacialis TaxID=89957 RepID=A0A813HZZ0_POLGL|nr:unnamed protein product [Polarella glacialis]